jgi:hypothetical protein
VIIQGKVSRGETCPKCSRDVRVCKNCNFFDKKYFNECREPRAERVVDKEKANFCDYFKIISEEKSEKSKPESKENAQKNFNDLFKS